jgi:hypothetical protein
MLRRSFGTTWQRKARGVLVALLLLGIAAALGRWAGLSLRPNAEAKNAAMLRELACLHVPESEMNLGEVYDQPKCDHVLHITNRGEKALKITQFRTSCNCTDVTPPHFIA